MSECDRCLNCVPALSACGKIQADWIWPNDHECIMHETAFPEAFGCEWSMELEAGEVISARERPGGIGREK